MTQVVTLAISCISSVATTDTDDGTFSPNGLKFTTYAMYPSGDTETVAGKRPSSVCPSGVSVPVAYFQIRPYGVPCPVETK